MSRTRELVLLWRRVTVGDATCLRCGDTGEAVERAAKFLGQELAPLGIAVRLEKQELTALAVAESNAVLFNGEPLEALLGAEVGQNHCPSCCELLGQRTDCRTILLDGREYEAIPYDLLVRAGRIAARRLEHNPPEER